MEKSISEKTVFKLTIPNILALIILTVSIYSAGNKIVSSIFTVSSDLKAFKQTQELFNQSMQNRMTLRENSIKQDSAITAIKLNNIDEKLVNIQKSIDKNSPYRQSTVTQK